MKKLLLSVILCSFLTAGGMDISFNPTVTVPMHPTSTSYAGLVPLLVPSSIALNPYIRHIPNFSTDNIAMPITPDQASSHISPRSSEEIGYAAKILVKARATVQISVQEEISTEITTFKKPYPIKYQFRKNSTKRTNKPVNYYSQQEIISAYELENVNGRDTIEEQLSPMYTIPVTDQKKSLISKTVGAYCPYCDSRFTNIHEAIAHSQTEEHHNNWYSSSSMDPLEYAETHQSILARWRAAYKKR